MTQALDTGCHQEGATPWARQLLSMMTVPRERLSYEPSDTNSAGRWRSERPGPKGRVETGTQELDNGGWQRVIFPQSHICYLALFQKEELSLLNQK